MPDTSCVQASAHDALAKSCAGGDHNACYYLAEANAEGFGVPVDAERARSLFERSCELGNAKACYVLASGKL